MTDGVFLGTGVTNETDGAGAHAGASKLVFHDMAGYAPDVFTAALEERERTGRRTAALVVAGFGAWPEAQLDVSAYVAQLARMLDELKDVATRIGTEVPIIFRPAPYACCAAAEGRRYTAKRGAVLTSLLRRAAAAAFPQNFMWWDTRSLGEARPLGEAGRQTQACGSNHMDSRLVHEDAQVLKHLLCVAADARQQPQPRADGAAPIVAG